MSYTKMRYGERIASKQNKQTLSNHQVSASYWGKRETAHKWRSHSVHGKKRGKSHDVYFDHFLRYLIENFLCLRSRSNHSTKFYVIKIIVLPR